MTDDQLESSYDDYGVTSQTSTSPPFLKQILPKLLGFGLLCGIIVSLTVILTVTLILTREKYKRRVVIATRLSTTPLIANRYYINEDQDISQYRYNSLPAYFQKRNASGEVDEHDYLIFEATSLAALPKSDFDVDASKFVWSSQRVPTSDPDNQQWRHVDLNDATVIDPEVSSPLGIAQPRVVYSEDRETYFMFYVTKGKDGKGDTIRQLAMRHLPKTEWEQGNFGPGAWSAEKAVLAHITSVDAGVMLHKSFNNDTYLFFGEHPNIRIARAVDGDLEDWEELPSKDSQNILLRPRDGRHSDEVSFDSERVSPGPVPLQLSEDQGGHYLFLYNSRQVVDGYQKENGRDFWNFRGDIGYVILDRDDNTKVIDRASVPLLSPTLDWERCDFSTKSQFHTGSVVGLEPNTVQVAGWKRIGEPEEDRFLIYYSGCGSFIGAAELKVQFQK
mmetsp:Transcript_8924/g.32938  ORF Transcript_8924/g.32938 Transcript_8924/m.32938 type:complete len:446 (-) Transcript_8924:459-1796(-)